MDKAASPYQLYVLTNKLLVRAATSGVAKHEITRATNESDPARGKGWQLCPGFSLPLRNASNACGKYLQKFVCPIAEGRGCSPC